MGGSRISRKLSDWAIGRVLKTALKQGAKNGARTLTKSEQRLASAVFVVTRRQPIMRYDIDDEQRAQWLQWVTRKKLTERPPRRFMDDAFAYLRQNSRVWGVVPRGRFEILLRYQREETFRNNDTARVFVRESVNPPAHTLVDGSWTLDQLTEHFKDDPNRLMELVERELIWKRAREACLTLFLVVAIGCGAYFGGKVVIRWVRSLSRIEHVQPAPPKALGGGVVVESCDRPAWEPEREALAPNTRDIGDFSLAWDAEGILTLARSTERERYLRWGPDTDWHWTWTITIDGAVHTYVTTSPTIRLIGAGGKRVSYTSFAKEWATLSLRGIGTKSVGDANYPVGETPITDGRVTVSKSGGINAPKNAHLLNTRETWRAPLLRYDCDAGLSCTFMLAPGPWHPCWQRVVVVFGDGTETDTRSAPPGVLKTRTWPQFLPADEPWFGAKDDWDRTRLRATHRYPRSGTYTLAFWLSSADPHGYSGPCDPSPSAPWQEPTRVFKEELRIGPRSSGKYPPNAGSW